MSINDIARNRIEVGKVLILRGEADIALDLDFFSRELFSVWIELAKVSGELGIAKSSVIVLVFKAITERKSVNDEQINQNSSRNGKILAFTPERKESYDRESHTDTNERARIVWSVRQGEIDAVRERNGDSGENSRHSGF